MSTDDGYNGWTNYETWAVALWINNDQGWLESVHEDVRSERDRLAERAEERLGENDAEPMSAYYAGEIVRENVEQVICFDFGREDDTMPANLSSDLVGRALERVSWDELGAVFLADVIEQDEYESRDQ